MSYAEDMGHDLPPDFGEDDFSDSLRSTSCKFCGSTAVEWEHQEGACGGRGRWVMFDYDGTLHSLTCRARTHYVATDPVMAMRRADRRGQASPKAVEVSAAAKVISKTNTMKSKEATMAESAARTMYDFHQPSTGAAIMICMMDDNHLRNTIRVIATNFVNKRNKMQAGVQSEDPMIRAMASNQSWGPEVLERETKSILRNLAPYVMEATLRGESVREDTTQYLRLIVKRCEAIHVTQEVAMIGVEEEEELH